MQVSTPSPFITFRRHHHAHLHHNAQPDVLELLFDYGGPPGCMDTVHTLSATIVQLTFRNWWWRGHRGPYSATVAAEWRNIELTFQLSLSQGTLECESALMAEAFVGTVFTFWKTCHSFKSMRQSSICFESFSLYSSHIFLFF